VQISADAFVIPAIVPVFRSPAHLGERDASNVRQRTDPVRHAAYSRLQKPAPRSSVADRPLLKGEHHELGHH
jgi:hypothetical protein